MNNAIIAEKELSSEVSGNLKRIAAAVSHKRKTSKLTVYRLHKLSGVSQNTIKNIEEANHTPRIDSLIRLCRTLEIPFMLL